MPAFMTTPPLRIKIQKLRLELRLLKIKEKLFGTLSAAECRRIQEIMRELSIKY